LRKGVDASGVGGVALQEGIFAAFFYRGKGRSSWAKAIVATAHKVLTIAFCMLCDGRPYRDLGDDYFDKLNPARTAKRLIARLEALGVTIQATMPPVASAVRR